MSETERILLSVVVDAVSELAIDAGLVVDSDTVLTSALDSFGLLDAVLLVEERSGLSVDLSEIQVEGDLTVGLLVREVLRMNRD